MKLKQISVFLENKRGAVSAPLKVLADAGVDITTLAIADTSDFGVLRLIVKEWETALDALKKNSFAATVNDVTAIEVEDVPGGLLRISDLLTELELDVEYIYAAVGGKDRKAVLIFRFEKEDEAGEKLAASGKCRILDEKSFFSMRHE